MSNWLLRGLVFAALMVIVRLLQGAMINAWETKAGLISIVLVVLFAVVVFIWGLADGRSDARANPDPDRRGDLAMTWLLAGLFAGIVSGAVAWFIGLFYKTPLRRGTDQRANHLRGVHRTAGVPDGPRGRRARPLARRPQPRKAAASSSWPRRGRRRPRTRPRRHRCVRGRPPSRRRGDVRGRDLRDPTRSVLAEAGEVSQGQDVALCPEADDHSGRHSADVGVAPKLLALVHIRDVHLDQRPAEFGAGVA